MEANTSKRMLLTDILSEKAGVNLEFINFELDETTQGDPIIMLTLAEPQSFTGRRLNDRDTGDSVRLRADDVDVVIINPSAIAVIKELEAAGESVFTWKEAGKSGTIKSDKLVTDVSSNQEVWISDQKFAKFGAQRRRENQTKRNSSLVNRLRVNQTKKELGNVTMDTKPEPVAGQ
jgi:hypothetical protein